MIRKVSAKNCNILHLSVCCSSEEHLIFQQNQSSVSPSKVYQPATAFIFENRPCIQMPLQKAADFEDCRHDRWGLLQDAAQTKLDVLSAVHLKAEPWSLITPTTIKNCSLKCGFSVAVSSNDDSASKLTEDEEDDWRSLQPRGVQSEDYSTCHSALKVCEVKSVDQVLDQHMTRPEEEP
jgi:hypothetical protein